MAAGLSRVLGTGFYLRGFYWQPLDACSLERGSELRGFARQAGEDELRRVPPLNEYSVLLAEFGVPGLLLFPVFPAEPVLFPASFPASLIFRLLLFLHVSAQFPS